jgi:hypothetical protein
MEGDFHGQRQATWFLWKVDVKQADIHRRLSAVCGGKTPAHSAVLNRERSFNSGKETAQVSVHEWYQNTQKNGSAKPSGSSLGEGSGVCRTRVLCWASSCLVFSLKITNCCKLVQSETFPNVAQIFMTIENG